MINFDFITKENIKNSIWIEQEYLINYTEY